jgi:hypothetical protein
MTMIPASLPFEYLHHFHRHDRDRKIGPRPDRLRRGTPVGRAIDRRSMGSTKFRVTTT